MDEAAINDDSLSATSSPLPEVGLGMLRPALWSLPVAFALGALFDGLNGALSVGVGVVIVTLNFLLSAYMLSWAVQISYALVTSVALGGFFMRMLIIGIAVWLIKDASWVNLMLLGVTIVLTHLGLLAWEMRYVSASMAHPGLKPKSPSGSKPAAGYRYN